MIQKSKKGRRKKEKIFFLLILSVALMKTQTAGAQQLPPVSSVGLASEAARGTPVAEIMAAINSGGLAGIEDAGSLTPPADSSPSLDEAPAPDLADPAPEPVALTADSIQTLESQGGISSKPQPDQNNQTIFKLAVRFLEKVVFRNETEFAKRPAFDNGMDISGTPTFDTDTAGYAIIKKGNQSVVVDFDNDYDAPPVVTATLSLQQVKDNDVRVAAEDLLLVSDVKYIVADVTKHSFQIIMDRQADSDIPFSWHALAVKDPQISKKEGDKIDNNSDSVSNLSSTGSVPSGASKNQNIPTTNARASDFSLTGESSTQAPAPNAPSNITNP